MGAANILNNTILLPSSDSLVSSHPLPAVTVAGDVEKFNNSGQSVKELSSTFIVKFKGPDSSGKTIEKTIGSVQEITGLSMTRENKQYYSGGVGNYVVNLPGNVSYGDVTIRHLYTKDTYFLDWITAGATQGGCPRVDIVIEVHTKKDPYMIFTLQDAFPTSWELDELSPSNEKSLIMETLTFSYSKIVFSDSAS